MRLFLEGGLVACGYGEMYAKVTGDVATARQFERVREKMLAGLKGQGSKTLPARPGELQAVEQLDPSRPSSEIVGWQQLTLL